MGAVEILSDHTRRQTVISVVGATNNLVFTLVSQNGHHRSEDFLAHDGHVVAAVGKHRWRDPGSLIERVSRQYLSAAQQRCTFFLPLSI